MTRSPLSDRLQSYRANLSRARLRHASGPAKRHPTELVRFVLLHMVIGAMLGVATACALLITNAAGLRSLILGSEDVLTPLFMLIAGFAITIGGLYVASAVMLHDRGE